MVTLSSKIVLAKMDFCGTGIAKKGNDRHIRFGWNYGLAGIMIIFINRIDPDSIRFKFKFKIGQNYVLILAEIIKFPKKEVMVTLSSKIVLAKMDFFVERVSPKKETIDTSVLA